MITVAKKQTWAPVIAIDGPSGSGKSSVAQLVAQTLQIQYIDTGALYRAIAFWAHQEEWAIQSGPTLTANLANLHLDYAISSDCLVQINGINLTQQIRQHFVSQLASDLSRLPEVRQYLLDFQRQLGAQRPSVMEGRDIGTVIFPNACCKIFLTALPAERAHRRHHQLLGKGQQVDYQQVLGDVMRRDENDSTRENAPLLQATDAFLLDSTNLQKEQVVAKIVGLARQCFAKAQLSWAMSN